MTGRAGAAQDENETLGAQRLRRDVNSFASILWLLLVGGTVKRAILDCILAAPTVPPSINNRPKGSTGTGWSIIVGSPSPFLHGSKTFAAQCRTSAKFSDNSKTMESDSHLVSSMCNDNNALRSPSFRHAKPEGTIYHDADNEMMCSSSTLGGVRFRIDREEYGSSQCLATGNDKTCSQTE
jgi:hypothetical protein